MIINDYCENILPTMDDESIQLIITSPPYNMGRPYEGKISMVEWYKKQEEIINECHRLLKDEGSLCYQVGTYVDKGVIIPLDVYIIQLMWDYYIRNRIVWTFNHGYNTKRRFSGRHETIVWGTKGEDYVFNLDPIRVPQKYPNKKAYTGPNKGKLSCNPLGKNPGDVWEITNVKNNHPEKTEHPNQFPEKLVKRLVLSLSNPGDTVMDMYAGSGTVCKVCKDLDREYILIEKESKYCDIIRSRLNGKQKTF